MSSIQLLGASGRGGQPIGLYSHQKARAEILRQAKDRSPAKTARGSFSAQAARNVPDGRAPIPWQQFVEPLDGMLCDARQKTSASQACGSTSFILAVTIRLYITAARSPPRSKPQNSHDFRPRAIPRRARSAALFDKQVRPSSRKRVNAVQRLSM